MLKFVIAGILAIAAAGLGVGGYQAGYFDSFKPMAENTGKDADAPAEKTVAAAEPDAAQEPGKAPSVLPTFDVVHIEPTGDAVVAGLSAPKAQVALVANGAVIGKTTANTSGEWAIVLSEPLAPGDYDVAIQAAAEDGTTVESTQRVTVSVPKSQTDQVLVVMNAEGEASTILQKPATEPASSELVVAKAKEQGASEKTRAAAALQEKPATVAAESTAPEAAPEAVVPETVVPETVVPETVASETVASETATPAPVPADAAPVAEQAATEPQAPAAPEAVADTSGAAVETQGTAPATAEPVAEQPEAETEIAQTAPAEEPAAMAAASQETQTASGAGVDTAASGEATVTATDATDMPAESVVAAEAEAPASDAVQVAAVAETPATAATPAVSVEAVESEKGQLFVAGTSNPGSSVRVYVGKDYVGDTKANPEGRWLVEADKPLEAGQHDVRADQVEEVKGDVVARAEVTFEREKDDVILVPVGADQDAEGDGGDAPKQLPNVIIRRGDNLWRISQRLYGKGVRYTTIYQANRDQIRDPDLIYPGQIFITPQADESWSEAEAPLN